MAFNVSGHCYYLEDGVEEHNNFEYNLAVHIKPIFESARGFGQIGTQYYESNELREPADVAAAGFYISNANNRFYGHATPRAQPSVHAIAQVVRQLQAQRLLAFYVDTHAHATKRG